LEKIFIDTSFWIAFLNKRDQFHKEAEDCFPVLLEIYRIQTSNFIVYETITFINCFLKDHQLAIDFLDKIEDAQKLGQLYILKVADGIQEEALNLFRKIEDKDLSFIDCTSFTLMKKEEIAKALTFDEHFEQMGFIKEP
jgi:hypothetical protein